MHKNILKLLIILSFFVAIPVYAECTYKEQAELTKEAANIKVNYEIFTISGTAKNPDTDVDMDMSYDIFRVNILNLSDNFYIKYTNNVNKDSKTFYQSNANDGIISFNWEDLRKVTTMTFNVYASNKTNCKDEAYRTIYLTLPRYNDYANWGLCDGKNLSVCEQYVTFNEISYDEFIRRVTNDTETNTSNNGTTNNTANIETNNNNYTYLYIGIGVVALIIVVIAVVRMRKRNTL